MNRNRIYITPADRLSSVSEYYFSRKLKEVARLNAEGADIISLGIGGPDMPPPESAIEKAVATLRRGDTHSYQPSTGLPQLRRAMADWYARYYGVEGLDPDTNILPLTGSKEGVFMLSMALLNPGDTVLVPDPGYPTYTSAPSLVGANVKKYTLSEENGWKPNFESIEKEGLEGVKMMWINYPHMPTGTPADKRLFEEAVAFGQRNGILIVNDNPYSFILNSEPLSLMQTEGAFDCCIEFNSLSKCLDMAGWRVGMMVGRPDIISWVLKVKSNIDSGQPRAIMEGAVEALSSEKDWYDSLNAIYASRQRLAGEIMEAIGCRCTPGQQGLFLWGRLPEGAPDAEQFADEILYNAGVFITPGFIFGENGRRYIRISLCSPEEKLKEALERIKRYLWNYNSKDYSQKI